MPLLTLIFIAHVALNLCAFYKIQSNNTYKQYMQPLLFFVAWQYLFLILTDLFFPEASEVHFLNNDETQIITWSIFLLPTIGLVAKLTRDENEFPQIESGFLKDFVIPIYLLVNLLMLYFIVMEKAIFQIFPKDIYIERKPVLFL